MEKLEKSVLSPEKKEKKELIYKRKIAALSLILWSDIDETDEGEILKRLFNGEKVSYIDWKISKKDERRKRDEEEKYTDWYSQSQHDDAEDIAGLAAKDINLALQKSINMHADVCMGEYQKDSIYADLGGEEYEKEYEKKREEAKTDIRNILKGNYDTGGGRSMVAGELLENLEKK